MTPLIRRSPHAVARTPPPSPPRRGRCHLCGCGELEIIDGFEALPRVTSDCQPWPVGGTLVVCNTCGGVQHPIDDAWHEEVGRIYAQYEIYHQSAGVEQAVFDLGGPTGRSEQLLRKLISRVQLPSRGRLLDIGCGNGSLLQSAGRVWPSWTFVGTELSAKHRDAVLRLPGVEAMHAGPVSDVDGKFNLITLVHVLEHVPRPAAFLDAIKGKLLSGGALLVEVPDHDANPYDLLIADHASHFSRRSLISLFAQCGWEVVEAGGWVSKEITLVVRASETRTPDASCAGAEPRAACEARRRVAWLGRVIEWARSFESVTLFGTSIAATWLWSILGDRVTSFVDEDSARVGRAFRGRPVLHPTQAPRGADVLLVLPPAIAAGLKDRLDRPGVRYHLPPAL